MPSEYYNRNFDPQYFYHIFNRGAYKNKIFLDKKDYKVFTSILSYYLNFPTAKHFSYRNRTPNPYVKVPNLNIDSVRLVSYCLMPNHFHLLLKQLPQATKEINISNLMRRLSIAYAMYFKYKYRHSGALFESKYKSVTVDSDEQLLYLSKYIHLNPINLVKKLEQYPYSSYPAYLNQAKTLDWIHSKYVLELQKDYQKFVESPTKGVNTKKIETLTLD